MIESYLRLLISENENSFNYSFWLDNEKTFQLKRKLIWNPSLLADNSMIMRLKKSSPCGLPHRRQLEI